MTDLEYDLELSIEWMPNQWEDSEAEVDCEETAKNLSKIGYQKVIWHNAKKELPERLKYVLGYNVFYQTFAVVKRDWCAWFDANGTGYNIDYWTELPKLIVED